MTRLTNQMRDVISKNVLAHAYTSKLEAANAAIHAAGDAVYSSVITADMRQHMDVLPKAAFCWASEICVNAGHLGTRRCLLSKPQPCFFGRCVVDDASRHLVDAYDAAVAAHKALTLERDKERASLRAVLASFTTVARLEAEWPEVRSMLPAGPVVSVPALSIAALNTKLGLPA